MSSLSTHKYHQLFRNSKNILQLKNTEFGFELRLFANERITEFKDDKNQNMIEQGQRQIMSSKEKINRIETKLFKLQVDSLELKLDKFSLNQSFQSVNSLKQFLIHSADFNVVGSSIVHVTNKNELTQTKDVIAVFQLSEQMQSPQIIDSFFENKQMGKQEIQGILLNISYMLTKKQQTEFTQKRQINQNQKCEKNQRENNQFRDRISQISLQISEIKQQLKNKITRVVLEIQKNRKSILEDVAAMNKKRSKTVIADQDIDFGQKIKQLERKIQNMPKIAPFNIPQFPMIPMKLPENPNQKQQPNTLMRPQLPTMAGTTMPSPINPPPMLSLPSMNSSPLMNPPLSLMNLPPFMGLPPQMMMPIKRIKLDQVKAGMKSIFTMGKLLQIKKISSKSGTNQRNRNNQSIMTIGDSTGTIDVYYNRANNFQVNQTINLNGVEANQYKGRLQIRVTFQGYIALQLIPNNFVQSVKMENNLSKMKNQPDSKVQITSKVEQWKSSIDGEDW